jgi:hypothetical protein
MQDYGSKHLKLSVQNIWGRGGGGKRGEGGGENLKEIEYEDESHESGGGGEERYEDEDDFEDEEEEEEGAGGGGTETEEDDEQEEKGKEDTTTISLHKYQSYFGTSIVPAETNCRNDCVDVEQLQPPQSFLQFDLETFKHLQSPLPQIIANRMAKTTNKTLTNHPLTTRSVERMFSYWKRLMGRNVDTTAYLMQAILLLSCFTFTHTLNILKKIPTTPAITKFLQTLTSTNTKVCLDACAYYKMKEKTTKIKQQTLLRLHLSSLRTKYSLPPPTSQKFWTKDHSIQYLNASEQSISKTNIQKLTANFLLHFILKQTTLSEQDYKELSLPCPPLSTPLPQTSEPLTITHVVEKEVEQKKGKLYEVESVQDHKNKKRKYEYCVKWEGYEGVTWEQEENLSNTFILTEYWKDKAVVVGKMKEVGEKREEDEYEGDECEYEVEKILDHEKYEGGIFFYKVEWRGGKVEEGETCTWIPESNFEGGNEVMLREYWKWLVEEEERKKSKGTRKKKR